jgi:antirestriction protein ArdC
MRLSEKALISMDKVLKKFESGDVLKDIEYLVFNPPTKGIPCFKWTLLNRIMAYLQCGETDCRGSKQWLSINRKIKKGGRAVFILAPNMITKENEQGEKEPRLIGFRSIPVFPLSQTVGDSLDYDQPQVGEFKLLDVAKSWGLKVNAGLHCGSYTGMYLPGSKKINLSTPEQKTFFHELSHAAQDRLGMLKGIKKRTDKKYIRNEITAEFSAVVLEYVYGNKPTENNLKYIESYAAGLNKKPVEACLYLLSDTSKILQCIMDQAESNGTTQSERVA